MFSSLGTHADCFEKGEQYRKDRNYEEAINWLTRAIELEPNFAPAYNSRGVCYRDQPTPDDNRAILDFTDAIRLDPNAAVLYRNRGDAHYALGNRNSAITDYNMALERDDKLALAWNSRALVNLEVADEESLNRAIDDATRAIELDPKMHNPYRHRGHAYLLRGSLDKCLVDLNNAIILKPDYGLALYTRGKAHLTRGDFNGAMDDLDKAAQLINSVVDRRLTKDLDAVLAEASEKSGRAPTPRLLSPSNASSEARRNFFSKFKNRRLSSLNMSVSANSTPAPAPGSEPNTEPDPLPTPSRKSRLAPLSAPSSGGNSDGLSGPKMGSEFFGGGGGSLSRSLPLGASIPTASGSDSPPQRMTPRANALESLSPRKMGGVTPPRKSSIVEAIPPLGVSPRKSSIVEGMSPLHRPRLSLTGENGPLSPNGPPSSRQKRLSFSAASPSPRGLPALPSLSSDPSPRPGRPLSRLESIPANAVPELAPLPLTPLSSSIPTPTGGLSGPSPRSTVSPSLKKRHGRKPSEDFPPLCALETNTVDVSNVS